MMSRPIFYGFQYPDGEGSNRTYLQCRSYENAVIEAMKRIKGGHYVNEELQKPSRITIVKYNKMLPSECAGDDDHAFYIDNFLGEWEIPIEVSDSQELIINQKKVK